MTNEDAIRNLGIDLDRVVESRIKLGEVKRSVEAAFKTGEGIGTRRHELRQIIDTLTESEEKLKDVEDLLTIVREFIRGEVGA